MIETLDVSSIKWVGMDFIGTSEKIDVVCQARYLQRVMEDQATWGRVVNNMYNVVGDCVDVRIIPGISPKEPNAILKMAAGSIRVPCSQVKMLSEVLWSHNVQKMFGGKTNPEMACIKLPNVILYVSWRSLSTLRTHCDIAVPAAEKSYDKFLDELLDQIET